jgi:hypothetical protein
MRHVHSLSCIGSVKCVQPSSPRIPSPFSSRVFVAPNPQLRPLHQLNLLSCIITLPSFSSSLSDRAPHVAPETSVAMALSIADGLGFSVKLSLLLALCALFVAHRFWIWYRLSHVPGPLSASLWKGWMLRHTLSGRMNLELKTVCDQYGECACLQIRLNAD